MTISVKAPDEKIRAVSIRRFDNFSTNEETDRVAVEEPLEIRLGAGRDHRAVAITMRTPGQDAGLAVGFLFTEGILNDPSQIRAIKHCGKFPNNRNTIRIDLTDSATVDFKRLERNFYTTSSCGVCGKSSLEALAKTGAKPLLSLTTPNISAEIVHQLPKLLSSKQSVFGATGGLHAAAIFNTEGNLLEICEDIGRHNAVDKLIGGQFLAGSLPLSDKMLFLSGRASFELVQKAVMAQIPIICAIGAPSSLAVDTAIEFGVTLLGFVRENRFNIYSGKDRLV